MAQRDRDVFDSFDYGRPATGGAGGPDEAGRRPAEASADDAGAGRTPDGLAESKPGEDRPHRARASSVRHTIWTNFHAKREINRAGAYRQLLDDLTRYGDILVPYEIGWKDMVGLCMDIEGYLKGDSGEQGASPLEAVRHFLCDINELSGVDTRKMN